MSDRYNLKCTDDPSNYNPDYFNNIALPLNSDYRDTYNSYSDSSNDQYYDSGSNVVYGYGDPSAHIRNMGTVFTYGNINQINFTGRNGGDIFCLVKNKWLPKENLTEPVREFWE